MNIDQPQCRSKRDRPLSRLAVCIDFGGSNIRASVATIDGTKAPVFRLIKKWPGRSGEPGFVPNLVAVSRKTGNQLWGYHALNALSDNISEYEAHRDLKRWLMKGNDGADESPDDVVKMSACLCLMCGVLEHILGPRKPGPLLVVVAVPVHVAASGANRYFESWRLASPFSDEHVTTRILSEADLGAIGMEAQDQIDIGVDEDLKDFTFDAVVDFGSTTMDVSIKRRESKHLVLAKSKERGFDEINNVIWASDLSLEDKANLDGKLEDRKSDVGQWQKSTPNGPQGLKREIPDIMLELKKKECTLVEDLVDSLAEIVESVLSGSEENIEIILIGGGVGSVLLNSHIRERLERDCIRITTSEGAVYSCQPVLAGAEIIAADPERSNTTPICYDIFLRNYTRRALKPLMLWDHSTSKLTSPIIYNLSVEGETDQVINELTASFEVFVPQNARGKVATRKFRTEPVRTAYSTKHLKSTGKYDVALPIAASQASIYIFAAIFGQALHFGILYRKDGLQIPELETKLSDANVFEGGLFSGRLKEQYLTNEFGYTEAARVVLSRADPSYGPSKQPPKTKLRRPNKVTIIEVSDDTGEEDTDDKSVPKSASGQKRKRDIQGAHDRANNSKKTEDFFSYYVSGDH